MRAYVTGGTGFVGTWLIRHLESYGDEIVAPGPEIDVRDPNSLEDSLTSAAPEVVYHLAGMASVGESWSRPADSFAVNAAGTLNLLQAAQRCDPRPKVLLVSSAEVYGRVTSSHPLDESAELRPVSPYAASKVAAEFLGLQAFSGTGLEVLRVRPFNHIGPGQSDAFVVSALARRIVLAERRDQTGGKKHEKKTVAVGNLDPVRDFTDVRDVVRAYRLLAERGEPGEVYNLSSGRGVSVRQVAELLVDLAKDGPLELETDPELVRPVDVPVLLGDSGKLRRATGWTPSYDLASTLADVVAYWRQATADTR